MKVRHLMTSLLITVQYIRRAVHEGYCFIIYQGMSGIYHILTDRTKAEACRMYVVSASIIKTYVLLLLQ